MLLQDPTSQTSPPTMRTPDRRSTACLAVATALLTPLAAYAQSLQPRAGDPLPDLTPAQRALFTAGRVLYATPISPAAGMGPIFNKSNCQSCHSNPVGGWGSISVTHFGITDKGSFSLVPGETQSLLQSFATSEFCKEQVPATANFTATRVTNSSLAFGMVEAIPDAAIAANGDPEDANDDGISGRVHWVQPLEDPTGPLRVGRFGWKAQVATVLSFSADATRNEMGVTNRLLVEENAPNSDTARLSQCDPILNEPEDVPDTEGYAFIDRVTHFQRYLSVPPQTPKSGMSGETVFIDTGCAKCHVPEWQTDNSATLEAALRNKVIRPYSDFLLHDVGLLADGVTDGSAFESELRTPVLWNLRSRDPMLHNGAAAGGTFAQRVTIAIEAHGPYGEGAGSAAAFAKLSPADKAKLVAFLDSLGRMEFDATGDQRVTYVDFLAFKPAYGQSCDPDSAIAMHDVDQNGVVNMADFTLFMLAYEGENGDCNRNGVPDLQDLLLGTSVDANFDGKPDECLPCVADLTGDRAVNGADLGLLLGSWGQSDVPADINLDGVVNGSDLGQMLGAWGACP